MGSKAKPFLAQKWEQEWHKPVKQWRKELAANCSARRNELPEYRGQGRRHHPLRPTAAAPSTATKSDKQEHYLVR